MFKGVYTALITPFKNGAIDYAALERIIEMQIAGGVDGLVPMGTTGESPTVSFDEHKEFIKTVVKLVNGRIKIVAGTGANSTSEAVYLTKCAADYGVDGVLQVNPYYNKPTQKGMILHFSEVARSVKIPVMLYNMPGRCGVNFEPESVKELVDSVDNIVSIKEASGNIAQMMRVIELCGNKITLLSGDDNLLLPVMAIGGNGVVSVLSNFLPAQVKSVVTLYENGRITESRQAFYRLLELCRVMFIETNPIPIKATMEILGFCSGEMRLPMTELTDANRIVLKKALQNYGINV